MANTTRDLRRRIRSVRSTAQLTKAMKMVAAAKLRRAQDALLAARPYADAMRRVLAQVARRASPEHNPLLAVRPERRVDLFVLTGDKGLCGSFNSNILRAADHWREARVAAGTEVQLTLLGRKATEHYRRRPQVAVHQTFQDMFRNLNFIQAQRLATEVELRFVAGESDGVFLAYNQFRSAISHKVVVEPLLPLAELTGESPERFQPEGVDFIYEPAPEELLARLLSRYLAFELFHAMLESAAAEHAARMSSMENATRNALEMIDRLTLVMNRLRQAAITKEIIEVVSAGEALAG